MTANDNKSYLNYLIKLVDQYNNTYHHFIGRKPISVYFSALTEIIEANPKAPMFKVNNRVRITRYKNILVLISVKQTQNFIWVCITTALLMENKALSLKPTVKMIIFELNFVSEAYLMDLVLVSLEKYL